MRGIWYGWILREPHVVPVLIVLMIGFWAVALGQHDSINHVYHRIFSFLFERHPTTEVKQQQGKPAWQRLQWCNAERERLAKEVERLEKQSGEKNKK